MSAVLYSPTSSARLTSGDTITSTGVTALMWPIHAWRVSRAQEDNDALDEAMSSMGAASAGMVATGGMSGGVLPLIIFGGGFAYSFGVGRRHASTIPTLLSREGRCRGHAAAQGSESLDA